MSERIEKDEWQTWRDAWQDPAEQEEAWPAELAERVAKVKRSSRRFGMGLVVLTASELVVSLASLLFVAWYVAQKPTPWRFAMFGLAALLVGAAQIFTLRNRRGTYRPQNHSIRAFVELEWLRTQRQLRTIRWSLKFFAFEMVALAALRVAELASDPSRIDRLPRMLLHLTITGIFMAAILCGGIWLWRRQVHRKMQELEPLRAAFALPP
jgi:hypothetical protein